VEILLSVAYTSVFIFLIGKLKFYRIEGLSANAIRCGLLIKIAAGISLGLVYTYYYTDRLTADTFKYFDDSAVIFNLLYERPADFFAIVTGIGAGAQHLQVVYDTMTNWYDTFSPFNDNRTMIRLNVMLRFISMGHYYVHVVFIAFLSLTGIVALVKVLKSEFPSLSKEFFWIFILLPSVLFWGSGLLKDSLVFFTWGMTFWYFHLLITEQDYRLVHWIKFLIFFMLLMVSKFQVFLLVPPLLLALWLTKTQGFRPWLSFSVIPLLYFGILLLPAHTITGVDLPGLLAAKQSAFFNLAKEAGAGSIISLPELEPNAVSLMENSPVAFITILCRPFITDYSPLLTFIAGLENTAILLFCLVCMFRISRETALHKALPWFCAVYTLTYFTLIGLTTPVLGAIVRYKAQVLPYLVIMFVMLSVRDNRSIINRMIKYLPD
jgi:hypothetical protein